MNDKLLQEGERCMKCEAMLRTDIHNPESQREWYEAGHHVCGRKETRGSNLLQEMEQLKLKLQPIRAEPNGCCMAIWQGSVCERKPDKELFVPALGKRTFVICDAHCKAAEVVFHSLGYFYKVFDHDYTSKQFRMFEEP